LLVKEHGQRSEKVVQPEQPAEKKCKWGHGALQPKIATTTRLT
jgi:hypothetical protein